MRQLLQNLIANALKFHRPGVPPVVDVRGEVTGSVCRLTIADNGIGFEEKYADRIFTLFERLRAPASYDGTGIGLAICRKIADYRLGEHDGLELLGRARELGVSAPMILLTGQGGGDVDLVAMRAGAADYLVKGAIDAPLLERSIRYALEQSRTMHALRESEARYALSARGANDGLWVWDLRTDHVYYSPRWKSMLGCEEDEIGSTPDEWFSRINPTTRRSSAGPSTSTSAARRPTSRASIACAAATARIAGC